MQNLRRKQTLGWIIFYGGIIIDIISETIDIWVIRFILRKIWVVGMCIAVNASIALRKNQNNKTGDGSSS